MTGESEKRSKNQEKANTLSEKIRSVLIFAIILLFISVNFIIIFDSFLSIKRATLLNKLFISKTKVELDKLSLCSEFSDESSSIITNLKLIIREIELVSNKSLSETTISFLLTLSIIFIVSIGMYLLNNTNLSNKRAKRQMNKTKRQMNKTERQIDKAEENFHEAKGLSKNTRKIFSLTNSIIIARGSIINLENNNFHSFENSLNRIKKNIIKYDKDLLSFSKETETNIKQVLSNIKDDISSKNKENLKTKHKDLLTNLLTEIIGIIENSGFVTRYKEKFGDE